jgi:hypothetical protein
VNPLQLVDRLPPLRLARNPGVALLVGLLFGGIGLAIYLRSLLDGLVPLVLVILLSAKLGGSGVAFGAAIAGAWGAIRVSSSNKQLAQRSWVPPTGVVDSTG